jgi:E3 ubiquitin-protein ligase HUWE1
MFILAYGTSKSSKVAIKMSRASHKIKDFDDGGTDSMSSISSEDDDQMDENDQRETPDLYRNSALGM